MNHILDEAKTITSIAQVSEDIDSSESDSSEKDPADGFSMFPLSPTVAKALSEMGFVTPSPIQVETIPKLLGKQTDFLGLAATGTGKTAAYGVPAIEAVDVKLKKVQIIVLCPTRELALQVTEQLNLIGKFKGVRSVAIYGGASYGDQIRGLRGGSQIVVGTPGRVIDHLERGTLALESTKIVILDEADEMVSMGFKEEIEKILESVPEEKKTWLFSATMGSEVKRVADRFLMDPQTVQINKKEMLSSTVQQLYIFTKESNKPEILGKIIDSDEDFYGLVFCQTKALVVDINQYLLDRGLKSDCLHGDKSQSARETTMGLFRNRKIKIMVCTDVAARGIDVKDVTHVIKFSIPRELDKYVHRIGRTARSGKSGTAISLVAPHQKHLLKQIERLTKSQILEGKIPSRKEIGIKKVAKTFDLFTKVERQERSFSLIGETELAAIKAMSPEEVFSRLVSLLHPAIFTEDRVEVPREARAQADEFRRNSPDSRRRGDFRGDSRGDSRGDFRGESRGRFGSRRDSGGRDSTIRDFGGRDSGGRDFGNGDSRTRDDRGRGRRRDFDRSYDNDRSFERDFSRSTDHFQSSDQKSESPSSRFAESNRSDFRADRRGEHRSERSSEQRSDRRSDRTRKDRDEATYETKRETKRETGYSSKDSRRESSDTGRKEPRGGLKVRSDKGNQPFWKDIAKPKREYKDLSVE